MGQCAAHADFFVRDFLRTQCGVAVGFVQQFAHVLERELPNRMPQGAKGFIGRKGETFVHRLCVVAQSPFAKQLGLSEIGVPTRVADPAAHKEVAPWYPISIGCVGVCGDAADFGRYFGRATFVGVQAENPIMCARVQRSVAQVAKAREPDLHHPCTQGLRDFGRSVGTPGVHHKDFVRPACAFDGGAHFFCFVVSNDVNRDERHGRWFENSLRV